MDRLNASIEDIVEATLKGQLSPDEVRVRMQAHQKRQEKLGNLKSAFETSLGQVIEKHPSNDTYLGRLKFVSPIVSAVTDVMADNDIGFAVTVESQNAVTAKIIEITDRFIKAGDFDPVRIGVTADIAQRAVEFIVKQSKLEAKL